MTQTNLIPAPSLQTRQLIARGVTRRFAGAWLAQRLKNLVPTRGPAAWMLWHFGSKGEILDRWNVNPASADFNGRTAKWDGYLGNGQTGFFGLWMPIPTLTF